MTDLPWTPTVASDETLEDATLKDWIGQAIGAASMCWVGGTGDLEFDSTKAGWIMESLHGHVQQVITNVLITSETLAKEHDAKGGN